MNRRELIKRSLSGVAALSLSTSIFSPVLGAAGPARAATPGARTTLRVVRRTIDVNGRAAGVYGLVQPDGKPGITLPAGTRFDVTLRNETADPTIIHWHGLTPPWDQDGVGDAPLPLIAPRAERVFDFPVGAAGTHWMHAHTLQEQGLLAAPLIVTDPADGGRDEQEVVTLLHDFSFTPAEELLGRLKGGAAAHGTTGPVDHARMAHEPTAPATPRGIPPMRMDLNDIDYDAYLANDRTLDDPEVVRVERGGRVRLRIINGATATAFTIDLGDVSGTLVAVDGQDIAPVAGRRFPISMGQRLDIRLVMPSEARAVPILALREGARERTGFILAPKDAAVRKMAPTGDADGPIIGMALEQTLRPARPPAKRNADKALVTTLVGDMRGYSWGLETKPALVVGRGDRVEITMTNMSMMAHPMHLHGHRFQVVAIDGKRFAGALRDTVLITPHRSVTIAVDAVNPGRWAFHCHHLYHMAAGMMATFAYAT